jgi:hypothetical protein
LFARAFGATLGEVAQLDEEGECLSDIERRKRGALRGAAIRLGHGGFLSGCRRELAAGIAMLAGGVCSLPRDAANFCPPAASGGSWPGWRQAGETQARRISARMLW